MILKGHPLPRGYYCYRCNGRGWNGVWRDKVAIVSQIPARCVRCMLKVEYDLNTWREKNDVVRHGPANNGCALAFGDCLHPV